MRVSDCRYVFKNSIGKKQKNQAFCDRWCLRQSPCMQNIVENGSCNFKYNMVLLVCCYICLMIACLLRGLAQCVASVNFTLWHLIICPYLDSVWLSAINIWTECKPDWQIQFFYALLRKAEADASFNSEGKSFFFYFLFFLSFSSGCMQH